MGCCLQTMGCCLQTMGCCLQTLGCCLQTLGCCLQTMERCLQTMGCCLQTMGRCLQTMGCCLQTMGCLGALYIFTDTVDVFTGVCSGRQDDWGGAAGIHDGGKGFREARRGTVFSCERGIGHARIRAIALRKGARFPRGRRDCLVEARRFCDVGAGCAWGSAHPWRGRERAGFRKVERFCGA
jgi:hypothetical protein